MNEITYALNSENKLVYINDVPNGENCNCSCPKCHAKLVAKTMEKFAFIILRTLQILNVSVLIRL